MFLKRWVLLLGGLLNGSELTVWRADLETMLTNGALRHHCYSSLLPLRSLRLFRNRAKVRVGLKEKGWDIYRTAFQKCMQL